MANFEVDNYIKQLKSFFEQNPNDLYDLIGKLDSEKFYKKVEKIAEENFIETGLVEITQDQLVNIVIDLYEESGKKPNAVIIEGIFQKTKAGLICLN